MGSGISGPEVLSESAQTRGLDLECWCPYLVRGFSEGGHMNRMANNFVHATAVCAILFVLGQVPAAPDDNR